MKHLHPATTTMKNIKVPSSPPILIYLQSINYSWAKRKDLNSPKSNMKLVQDHMKMGRPNSKMEDSFQKRKEISIKSARLIQDQVAIRFNLFNECQPMLRVHIHLSLDLDATDSIQQILK